MNPFRLNKDDSGRFCVINKILHTNKTVGEEDNCEMIEYNNKNL